MEEQYGPDFDKGIFDQWMKSIGTLTSNGFKTIRVSPENGWGNFSPRDGIRLMAMLQTDPLGEETAVLEEHIAKQVVKGKNVSFLADEQLIGRMSVITDTSQDLNADPLFIEKPILMQALISRVVALVVEKYTPPVKDTVPA